jgi:hypothetical protein
MSARVGRNDPCPCGSGLKYKHCCAGKLRLSVRGGRWVLGALGLVVAAGIAWGVMRSRPRPVASAPPSPVATSPVPSGSGAPATNPGPAGVAAQPWSYDAATNRHFDPNHGHWHDGPPPPPEARGAASAMPPPGAVTPGVGAPAAGPTPAPWTYDAANNQHWNPDHGHWHPGPPPAGSR